MTLLPALAADATSTTAAALPHDPALPPVWIAGDSTAAPGGLASVGWGVPFAAYFDRTKVNVANRARGGRISRTFITDGSWQKLVFVETDRR